jgi:hypothetical protein
MGDPTTWHCIALIAPSMANRKTMVPARSGSTAPCRLGLALGLSLPSLPPMLKPALALFALLAASPALAQPITAA